MAALSGQSIFFSHIFFNLGRQSNRYKARDTRGDLIRKNIMNVICYIIDCMDTYERLTCKILAMMTWALQLKTKKNLSENELFIANSVDVIHKLGLYSFTYILVQELKRCQKYII